MRFLAPILLLFLAAGCNEQNKTPVLAENRADRKELPERQLSPEFREYWYAGEAEISSYRLDQSRYGEQREGHAVLVYVTEPFLPGKQVKADQSDPSNVSVLKLNSTRKFLTGIYPYSIMSSTFSPVREQGHAIKVTNSVQEWCGQVFAQLNNRNSFDVQAYSYFGSEGDQQLSLPKNWLENELWNLIRINPSELPVGELEVIPSFEYLRLAHKDFKAYKAAATKATQGTETVYTLSYPDLGRSLKIRYGSEFPHRIEGWEETSSNGARELRSSAVRIATLKSAYWQKNSNKDIYLRDSLGL